MNNISAEISSKDLIGENDGNNGNGEVVNRSGAGELIRWMHISFNSYLI